MSPAVRASRTPSRSRRLAKDTQQTIALLRFHAAKWQIDPHKIAVLGFSAGGYLVAKSATDFASFVRACRCDRQGKLPARLRVAIYPGHLPVDDEAHAFNPNLRVTRQTPSTFLLRAEDDHVDGISQSLAQCIVLENAAVFPPRCIRMPRAGRALGLRSFP